VIVHVATQLPHRRSEPAVACATGVPNKARTSAFLFFNCFTAHLVYLLPRFLCNRLIVATIPLDFALSGLIIVSLWVLFSELAIAQAVCQTVVVRKGLDFPIASLACQDGKKTRPVESVESFDQKVGLDSAKIALKHTKCRYLVPGMRRSWFTSGGQASCIHASCCRHAGSEKLSNGKRKTSRQRKLDIFFALG
jgi:hypothetical protein